MSRACIAKGEVGVIRFETMEEAAKHRQMNEWWLPAEGSMLGRQPFYGGKSETEIVE